VRTILISLSAFLIVELLKWIRQKSRAAKPSTKAIVA
jgi:hypothetical protein